MAHLPRFIVWILMIPLMLVGQGLRATPPDVVVYTESYPPYNYLDETGAVVGTATAKVQQLLGAAGLSHELRLMPWARAVLFAETQPNALIFSMTRVPSRETRYDWLAPIADADFRIFKHANDLRTITFDAIRAGHLSAACVSGDLSCGLLLHIGLPEDKLSVVTNNSTGDFRMVLAQRADVFLSEKSASDLLRAREGFSSDLIVPALKLEGQYGFYLVAGLQVDEAIRLRVRAAYEALRDAGQYKLLNLANTKP